jgi:hypothetical protein
MAAESGSSNRPPRLPSRSSTPSPWAVLNAWGAFRRVGLYRPIALWEVGLSGKICLHIFVRFSHYEFYDRKCENILVVWSGGRDIVSSVVALRAIKFMNLHFFWLSELMTKSKKQFIKQTCTYIKRYYYPPSICAFIFQAIWRPALFCIALLEGQHLDVRKRSRTFGKLG